MSVVLRTSHLPSHVAPGTSHVAPRTSHVARIEPEAPSTEHPARNTRSGAHSTRHLARSTSRLTPLLLAFVLGTGATAFGETHLLVITGVAGDEEHAAKFHKWAATIIEAAKKRGGLTDANITYLADKPEVDAARIRARSTRDNVEKAFVDIAQRARPNEEVFVLLIGHGSFDGRVAAFNLSGPDLTADDYARLLAKLGTQRVVFVNTASSSGGFLAPLAAPGRILVTATKTGGERNETRFPEFFVEAFDGVAADTDRNGRISVFEAFDYARAKVADVYQKSGYILTEHAAIDDGREGKLAATLFLEADRSRTLSTANVTDPELRALLEEQRALEDQVAELKLRKETMPPAQYDRDMEKLLTELALKARAIRERGTRK